MASDFNDTLPVAPAGGVNVKWQTDGAGNDSAYVPSGSFLPAATVLNIPVNTYFVSPSGTPYSSITAAISAINAGTPPTATTPAVIYIYPGTYITTSAITVPQYVNIVGVVKNAFAGCIIQNNTTDVFACSGYNVFQNLTILQGTAGSATWAFNCGNNTDISVFDCAMYGGALGTQGFVSVVGSNWVRITIQDCIVNSYQLTGPICQFKNTSAAVRFCDTWIQRCFFDAYSLTGYGFGIYTDRVQDVRIEYCILRGQATYITGIFVDMSTGISGGAPQVEVRHCYTAGGVGIYNVGGTNVNILNSDVAGTASAGTSTVHNSYVGAAYNPLGPI